MSQQVGTIEPKIKCAGCGKQYKWKPELAGRKVKCKCGTILTAPTAPPPPPRPEPEDDLYALADDPAFAPANGGGAAAVAPIPPIRPIAMPAAAPVASAMTMPYRSRPAPQFNDPASKLGLEGQLGKDFILPIAMIVVGTIVNYVTHMVVLETSFLAATIWIGVGGLLSTILIAAGCVVAMKLLDFSLGAPLQALLKVAAIAIAPDAIGSLITQTIPFGGMLATFLTLGIYFALLMLFFDLDGTEVMITTMIFWVIQTWLVTMILLGVLTDNPVGNAIRASAGGAAGMVDTGETGGALGLLGDDDEVDAGPPTAASIDAGVEESLKEEPGIEAREFLQASERRTVYTVPRQDAMALVDRIYAAGATNVQATGVVEELGVATVLTITLPTDKSARQRVLAIEAELLQTREGDPTADVGQKYLELYFDD